MEHTLAVYLPVDRRHALTTGTQLPEHMQGAVLFADIAGFTPLTEALALELGARRGAEELPRQLNRVYDALIREVDRYGGSVIGFAGDAMTCWFDGDPGLRATGCGLALQAAMRAFATIDLPTGGTVSLAVKVAVVSGAVRRFLVGDPEVQLLDTLAGATLNRMAAAEQVAQKGEVVLDEATAHALGTVLDIQEWRTDESGARFAVVAALRESVEPWPWTALPEGSLTSEQLRPWLLPTVYERLQAGQGEFLTELRPAVALFLRFGGIDYDEDPEAGQKLDAFIRWVQSLLAQYEGTLIQLTMGEKGSYLYAAFGAPIAHEDDARRATLTALALRTPPEPLAFIDEVQVGLALGTMRTGAYGGATRRTYGVLGDEVNLAARLMQHARPGQIIASGRVQAATRHLFHWQALGQTRVRGKQEPIPLFVLLKQAQSRPIQLTEPTYTLPMVGRAAELATILEKLALARQGQGQIVGITAEAGMGKSRLVAEVIRQAQAQGITGYGGECHSYGTNTPYLVWQPIWRAFFDLTAGEPEQERQQLVAGVAALDATLLPRLPLLGAVLALPLADSDLTRAFGPELRKASREALLVDLLKARARALGAVQGALLLVLEDCHWLDGASHDLLEAIGRAIWNLPVLIVLAYRPPELERLAAPRVATLPHFTMLPLTELSEPDAARLIAGRLAAQGTTEAATLPAALLTQLTARAQGNPFYLEELLNYLHDQGLDPSDEQAVAQLELPTSLHRLILSRIDRLSESQKVALKVASIIGRLFRLSWLVGYYPALGSSAQVRTELDALARLDLTPLEQQEPERVYLFKHIVTREVAYESLPYATRAHLHEQLASFLEAQGERAVEGYLDLLAYHYGESENLAKKCTYLRRAGEAAQASYANETARAYYTRLLPLVTGEEQIAVYLNLGAVVSITGPWEEAEQAYQGALAGATALDSAPLQAQSALALGHLFQLRGEHSQALPWLEQAQAHFEALHDPAGISQTLSQLGSALTEHGAFDRARDVLERGLALARTAREPRAIAQTLYALGVLSFRQERFAEAEASLAESLALRQAQGDKRGMAECLNNLGVVNRRQRRLDVAQRFYEESLRLYEEIGEKGRVTTSMLNLGGVAAVRGELERASQYWKEVRTLYIEQGNKWGLSLVLTNLAGIAYLQQAYPQARAYFEEGLVGLQELGSKVYLCGTYSNLGNVLVALGDYPTARVRYGESLRLGRELGLKEELMEVLVGVAYLAVRENRDPRDLVRAVRLLAFAARHQEQGGLSLSPLATPLYEQLPTTARALLGEGDFAAAWAEGQALTLEEAAAQARSVVGEPEGDNE